MPGQTGRLPSVAIGAVSELSAAGDWPGAVVDASERNLSPLCPVPEAYSVEALGGVVRVPTEAGATLPGARVAQIAEASLSGILDPVRAALAQWGAERVGIVVGTSTGGIASSEDAVREMTRSGKPSPEYDFDRQHAFHALVDRVARATGARGPAYVVSSACSSSSKAFATAQRLIATSYADAVVVGGADSLCAMTLRGFSGLKVLSAGRSRPFDRERDGINIGEGAAFALVARDWPTPLAHLLGAGETSDAHHMTAPHPEGAGAVGAMQRALTMGGISPDDVDYVHAHGTGTPQNDGTEARAIAAVVGPGVSVSSTKGITGHLLGAAGSLSVAVGVDVIRRGRLPVNVGLSSLDPGVHIPIVREPVRRDVRHVVCNTFAFGGCNASVLLGRDASPPVVLPPRRDVWVTRTAFWAPGRPSLRHALEGLETDAQTPEAPLLDARSRGRASLLSRMVAEVVGQVGSDDAIDLTTAPMILGSAYGEMGTTMTLLDAIASSNAPLSPMRFQASVHNAALGLLSIRLRNQAFSSAIAAGRRTAAMALVEAFAWLDAHGGDVIVALADEAPPPALWRHAPFASMAMALHLSTEPPSPARPCLARLRHPSEGPLAGGPGRLSAYARNPSGGAVGLLEALWRRAAGPAALEAGVTSGWQVEVLPTESAEPRPSIEPTARRAGAA